MNKPLLFLTLVFLLLALLLGYSVSTNRNEGRIPQEVTANRIIVYMVNDTLVDALKEHETDGWYQFSNSFFSSALKISAAEGKEDDFRRIMNVDGIAEKTSAMSNNVKWEEDAASLTLKKENGGVAVPVWLLAILQEKHVLNP